MPETTAEAVAAEIAAAGVDRVFGLPGGEVLLLLDALRRRGVDFTLCRHEASAGIAAAVHGKLRGTAGVAVATLGPGASNLLYPLADSLLDREPLLAISAQLARSAPPSHTHQRLPLLDVFGPVTKLAAEVRPEGARTPSVDVDAAAPATAGPDGHPERVAEELQRRLAAADRPLLLVGLGTRWECAALLRRWVDDAVEVDKTWHASRPNHLGPGEPLRDRHRAARRAHGRPLGCPRGAARRPRAALLGRRLRGGAPQAPRGLRGGRRLPEPDRDRRRGCRRRTRRHAGHDRRRLPQVPVRPVLAGPGPGRFWMSNGLSGMGYGLPAAIGAKLARPDLPVLAVVGDGGFAMTAAELETARRAGAAVTVLVLADNSLSLIRLAQESRGLPNHGVDFTAVDSVRLAEAAGVEGIRAATPAELQDAVARTLAAGRPAVIEVGLDPDSYRGIV